MTKEKEVKEVKKSDNEDIQKSLDANWALTRRIKDWLEKIHGADIDGDGHIGPLKMAVLAFLLSTVSAFSFSADTNSIWPLTDSSGTNYVASVDKDGNFHNSGTIESDGAGHIGSTVTIDGTYADTVLTAGKSNGTTRIGLELTPSSSSDTTGFSYEQLFRFGSIATGGSWGFASTNHKTYGIAAYFGREKAAGSGLSGQTDSGLELVVVNTNGSNNAAYNIQGGHIKCYNYAGGVVSNITGLHIELDAAGTENGTKSALAIDGDADTQYLIDMDRSAAPTVAEIRFSDGTTLRISGTNLEHIGVSGAFTNRISTTVP